ncbi:RagB/SusD family nutrient uptake outer membrane protein [Fulvivirgaceae bacterium BMA12]|uniref:RagB/SusD family nutrient uptake outer membrane protein n=1 Tax=Agaribacillus aureus TaxID=3051825 RepID=A0ABT8LKU5_9BACT|nr:RagB/SusD family nutrient uptake outer membrane protein [Fulvivirgaceae bacterium BMA12]
MKETINKLVLQISSMRCPMVFRFIPFIVLLFSCQEFVDIDPPRTDLIGETVFSSDNTAIAAINGIYSEMIAFNAGLASGGTRSVTYFAGLSADELTYFGSDPEALDFYINSLEPANNSNTIGLWGQAYKIIFNANSVLEGLKNSTQVSEELSLQLEGEAKFLRAFCHFYLVNLYGDVPVATTTVYQENTKASKMSVNQVYEQIIIDLKDARALLGEDYPSVEKVRPNKAVATAMLSRAYLFTEDWSNAEFEASQLLDGTYSLSTDLTNVFLANSDEAIWQLRPAGSFQNTNEGLAFILTTPPQSSVGGVALSSRLLDAFEVGDQRRVNWINSFTNESDTWYYPFKYKVRSQEEVTEYSMVLRLAEQYLIRAEARAQMDNISGAIADLNVIRNRAGLPDIISGDKVSVLRDIEQERQVELFTEWGHRWLDLKRTGRADAIMGAAKAKWQAEDILYPLPQSELEVNPNLLPQNPGY